LLGESSARAPYALRSIVRTGTLAGAMRCPERLSAGIHPWVLASLSSIVLVVFLAATAYATVAPGAPRDAAAVVTADGLTLHWQAPTDNGGAPIESYRVFSDPPKGPVAVPGSTTTLTLRARNGYRVGQIYRFRVRATNQLGNSSLPSDWSAPIEFPLSGVATSGGSIAPGRLATEAAPTGTLFLLSMDADRERVYAANPIDQSTHLLAALDTRTSPATLPDQLSPDGAVLLRALPRSEDVRLSVLASHGGMETSSVSIPAFELRRGNVLPWAAWLPDASAVSVIQASGPSIDICGGLGTHLAGRALTFTLGADSGLSLVDDMDLGQVGFSPVVAPGGDWLAYNALEPSGTGCEPGTVLYARRHGAGVPPVRLSETGAQYSRHASWAPDGSRVAFFEQGDWSSATSTTLNDWTLVAERPDGTDRRLLQVFHNTTQPGVSWSPDGQFLAVTAPVLGPCCSLSDLAGDVVVVDAVTGESLRVAGFRTGAGGTWTQAPAWSPGGGFLAIWNDATTSIVTLAAGDVVDLPVSGYAPVWNLLPAAD
jgi:hypothetical protein